MASGTPVSFYRDLDLIAGSATVAGLGDAELLSRFALRRDATAEAAFEALVARHGPMVLATCRRSLRDAADADDAFQAAFLVLARKAGSVRVAGSLGPWLHAVARRVAIKAEAVSRKRRGREGGQLGDVPAPDPDPGSFEVHRAVLEELGRLPEKYRAPLVLCHLEGLTHEQAAESLRWPVGTVSGRLSRAREILRDRLTRRGLGVQASAVIAALSTREALAVPSDLIQTVVRAACGGAVSKSVFRLTRGVLIAMMMHKIKLAGIGIVAVAAVTVGVGYALGQIGVMPAKTPGSVAPPPATSQFREGYLQMHTALLQAEAPPTSINKRIQAVHSGDIVVVESPDGRSINAMSLRDSVTNTSEWKTYDIPPGLKVDIAFRDEIMAMRYVGPEIKEVAVFYSHNLGQGNFEGRWSKQSLLEPVKGKLVPITYRGQALYQAGNDIYEFSARTGQWAVLHLTGSEVASFTMKDDVTFVQQGQSLHVFSVFTGKWSKGVAIKPVITPVYPGMVPEEPGRAQQAK